jgi:ATP-binding cassette subfamily F protein 3
VKKCEARVAKIEEMRDKLATKLADPELYEDARAGDSAPGRRNTPR